MTSVLMTTSLTRKNAALWLDRIFFPFFFLKEEMISTNLDSNPKKVIVNKVMRILSGGFQANRIRIWFLLKSDSYDGLRLQRIWSRRSPKIHGRLSIRSVHPSKPCSLNLCSLRCILWAKRGKRETSVAKSEPRPVLTSSVNAWLPPASASCPPAVLAPCFKSILHICFGLFNIWWADDLTVADEPQHSIFPLPVPLSSSARLTSWPQANQEVHIGPPLVTAAVMTAQRVQGGLSSPKALLSKAATHPDMICKKTYCFN